MEAFATILRRHGLRDTQPRRLVIDALRRIKRSASPTDIQRWISAKGGAVNAVTVYRILAAFEKLGLVHRHPCDGNFSLCTMPGTKGHHGFLHCLSCGETREFQNDELCRLENGIARRAKFRPRSHVSEILGTCPSCS